MKPLSCLLLLVAAPMLMAALWMDEQPSYRPYEAPVISPPAGSVPVTGRESLPSDAVLKNPVPPGRESAARGEKLYAINCAMCHGLTSTGPGQVGRKLNPPPPVLDPGVVRNRNDAHIYRAVTFGFGRMPSFRDGLKPHERWDLVNFLRLRR